MSRRIGRFLMAVGTLAACVLGGLEAAAGPLGAEMRMSASSSGAQIAPVVVKDAAGNSVVVWDGNGTQSGNVDGEGIFLRRFDPLGAPLAGEMRVNTSTSGPQAGAEADMDANGNFVVVWEGNGTQGGQVDTLGVFAQRFNANGTKTGSEFRVNTFTLGAQEGPGVAMAPNGSFVVAWESDGQDGSGLGVYAQRFNPDGTPNGVEFRVNSVSTGEQAGPSLLTDSDGNLLIAWESFAQDTSGFGVFARRFNSSGPLENEFRVNTSVVGDQAGPGIDRDASGSIVVVWEGNGTLVGQTDTFGIFAQRFDATGAKVGSEFRVNTYTSGDQAGASLDIDPTGKFVATWESDGQDGAGFGVFAQRFDQTGSKLGNEFRVNATTSGDQLGSAIETDANGDFLFVWEGSGPGDVEGVFARRFEFSPPDTTILSGPSPGTVSTTASFDFSSTEAGSTFECLVDAGAFTPCSSPKNYSNLALGGHTFQVRATDAAANTDPTPAIWSWGVLDSSPPSVKLITPGQGRIYVAGSEVAKQTGYTVIVGALTLVGEGGDPQSGVTSFVFEIDGVGYAATGDTVNPDGTRTYTLRWTPMGLPGGHAIRALATNGAGLTAASSSQQVAFAV